MKLTTPFGGRCRGKEGNLFARGVPLTSRSGMQRNRRVVTAPHTRKSRMHAHASVRVYSRAYVRTCVRACVRADVCNEEEHARVRPAAVETSGKRFRRGRREARRNGRPRVCFIKGKGVNERSSFDKRESTRGERLRLALLRNTPT